MDATATDLKIHKHGRVAHLFVPLSTQTQTQQNIPPCTFLVTTCYTTELLLLQPLCRPVQLLLPAIMVASHHHFLPQGTEQGRLSETCLSTDQQEDTRRASWMLRLLFLTLPVLVLDLVRLLLGVMILAPGFVRFAWYYWIVAQHETVQYAKDSCRQRLDVYASCRRDDEKNSLQ